MHKFQRSASTELRLALCNISSSSADTIIRYSVEASGTAAGCSWGVAACASRTTSNSYIAMFRQNSPFTPIRAVPLHHQRRRLRRPQKQLHLPTAPSIASAFRADQPKCTVRDTGGVRPEARRHAALAIAKSPVRSPPSGLRTSDCGLSGTSTVPSNAHVFQHLNETE